MIKCNKCRYSFIRYDRSICAFVAVCDSLGVSKVISDFTEDEENEPSWDCDLGTENHYCQGKDGEHLD